MPNARALRARAFDLYSQLFQGSGIRTENSLCHSRSQPGQPENQIRLQAAAKRGLPGKEGLFFAEGPKLCLELAKGCHNKVIYYTDAALAAWPALAEMEGEQYLIPLPVAEKLAGVPSPQGVFGVFALPRAGLDDLAAGGHYLCMEAVQDPGNVGTLIRSAAAFGFDAVVCSAGCASPFGPKAVRASMGRWDASR